MKYDADTRLRWLSIDDRQLLHQEIRDIDVTAFRSFTTHKKFMAALVASS